ncbi:hypothetical protein QE152_g39116 [Popillia japonica]|uniref:Uncharacterized protein n=1 Tax=Popillia japonica TaxID=7064 RepID=A0AAW1HUX4_POPJA
MDSDSTDSGNKRRRNDGQEMESFGRSKKTARSPTNQHKEEKLDKIIDLIQSMKTEMGDMKNAIKEADSREMGVDMPLSLNTHITETNTKQKVSGMKNRTRIGTWNVRTISLNTHITETNTKQKVFGMKNRTRIGTWNVRTMLGPATLAQTMKNRTRIGTWNVRTMLGPATLAQTIKEMEVLHIKVLGLSEIRWPGQGERLNSNGSLLLYSGRNQDQNRANGVGFLLDKEEEDLRKWNKQLQQFSVTKQQQDGDNIDGKWVQIKEIIHGTARKVIGYREQERKKWISEDTWNMIKKRKELKAKLNGMDGNSVNYEDIRKEYRELNKGIKKRARKDKRIWADNLARRAEEAAASHNTREVYRNTRLLAMARRAEEAAASHNTREVYRNTRLLAKKGYQNDGTRDKEGQLLTTTEDQLERWKEYYTEMLTEDSVDEDSQMEEEHAIEDSLEIDVSKPTKLELTSLERLQFEFGYEDLSRVTDEDGHCIKRVRRIDNETPRCTYELIKATLCVGSATVPHMLNDVQKVEGVRIVQETLEILNNCGHRIL